MPKGNGFESKYLLRQVANAIVVLGFALPCVAASPTSNWVWPFSTDKTTKPSGDQPGIFPSIQAEALDRTDITVPGQLQGAQNLLLLSWARDQGPQLDSWTAVGQALQHTQPSFSMYRMPVNDPENIVFRWWDDASLRAAETDPQLLHYDIPLYTNKSALMQAIGLTPNEHEVVALLIDRSGHILWKSQGPSTQASRSALLNAAAAQIAH